MSRELNIGIMIRRNYGQHEISFQIAEVVSVESGEERRIKYDNLLAQLNDQIAIYERDHLGKVRLPSLVASKPATIIKMQVAKVSVEFTNGRKEIKIFGGSFTKFGVPIYADSVERDDLETHKLEFGVIEPKGYIALVEMNGDKPKRILSLAKNDE